ncbi:gliding motility-associated C-terminal domain-containing protein [Flavobacterium sp. AC]|uniref:Gliding motility-associated C-terminal domain-containing protein n=1 Tax=Flavobacterium azizsancarii TaxID=2961580 RepID=A0ABT4WDT4_9FLAO|nr:gliding motility-associated C-terminal domain-containing protein [Flavobacterium azizsancarii]MDA6070285.1 gliding motility-associated C-terminal domain-containing protein [Flavobacterium azizsancarii]
MVRFKVGSAPLNINTLTVTWPNNAWQGIVQDLTTAAVVAQLNTDISAAGGCGQILEPPGGILPANATAILVTSYLMVTSDNSFGPLSENIYMVFQDATTTVGHFANQSIAPPNGRTLVMNFSGCLDTVTYDKSMLTNTSGANTPADGATVNFTPAGLATYTNNGCKAPVPPFTVDAGPPTLTACAGATITLNGTAVGQTSVAWSASSGSFSPSTTTTTDYTVPTAAGGTTIVLTLKATNSCGLDITDNINLLVTSNTTPNFATTLTLCSSDTAPTLALTSPNGITGTWSPNIIDTATSGNYTFTPNTGQCGTTATLAVTITPPTIPDFATTLTLCNGDTAPTLALTSPNGITGTWNPAVVNTTTSGNYIFTPNAGQCATTATLAVTINQQIIPDFATTLTLCSSDIPPTLALTSPNGITGTWSPAVINTTTSGNYIFTPNAGQCATTASLAVTINQQIIPDFTTSLTLCSNETAPTLALTSPNGITGTWSPAVISTTTSGNYIFTPNAGQCSTTASLAVTINQQITPDFATSLPLCSSDTAPTLALTSSNGITGTWNPSVINMTTSGNYIFTPNAGQCATTASLAVTINQQIIPDFDTSLPLCSSDTAPTLALTSPNGITGTWSPAVINTTTSGNYIFTPNAGLCATTATLAVTINQQTIPDFGTTLTLCNSDTAPTLALTSPNGITGTWNPAVVSTTTSGNYTFTPNAGLCATTATLAVTINQQIIPDFATTLTLCGNETVPTLALTSPNGITGTWSPAVVSTTTDGNYIFTPNAGQCATFATLAVTINPQIIPDFGTTLTLCSSDIPPILALTSPNGISGTWNPAVINTTTSGNYIFTSNLGQCASTVTLIVTITPAIVPDFPAKLNFCDGTTPILQTTSPNGIRGTWSSSTTNNSGNYTFTPIPGQCATTASVEVTFTSPAYSITKECVNNRYLIKVETTSSSTNYSYSWVDDKGNPVGSDNATFDFSEYSENYNGLLQFPLQFKVAVNDGSCEVEEVIEVSNNLCGVPNAVSPNGDGVNDTFDLTDFNVTNIEIYNRWGRKVYDYVGKYDKQWYGQWKEGNMLPTGTYYYIISSENGDQKAGWVFLSY